MNTPRKNQPDRLAPAQIATRTAKNHGTGSSGFHTALSAIGWDRAQRDQHEGTLHTAVIAALVERSVLDHDAQEGYTYRQQAVEWARANPQEFHERYLGPLLDEIEQDFYSNA